MWSLLFLFLSYLDGDFVKGEISALDAEKDSYFLLNTTSCANTSACRVHLSHQKADGERQDAQDASGDIQTLRRSKRGFTYPGTLWCGAGNIADNYDQLGEFAETDRCCRTHDYCPHVIHAFSSKYGFTNFKWHSISHCDCDNAMKQCLRAVNDTSSRVVGQAFFNVIEVPCFEFSLEEQCVERHWYGVCKRYEKVPVAVIRESMPYDFGGIEVIDVLTVAPPKIKLSEIDEGKKEESQRSESTTQSSTSGSKNPPLEEPSLTNVVTAAEDFIKVLATVSTSQSSSTDGGNTGEAQASDKKRKKNAGKKKKDQKKRRGKGKGKKRKQNTGRVPKVNVTVSPSANRGEDVINKKTYVGDPGNFDWVSKNDNFMNSRFSPVGDTEHNNKMMRDEHQRTPDESQVAMTTAPDAKQEAKIIKPQKQIKDMEFLQLFPTVTVTRKSTPAIPKERAAKKRQRHPTPKFLPVKDTLHNMMTDNTAVSTNKSTSLAGLTAHTPISLPWEKAPHNVESQREKGSAFNATAQNTPIVGAKRLRSRQKGGRRKSRKPHSSSSPTDTLTTEEPNVLPTDTTQDLSVSPFPEIQNGSQKLQPNGPNNMSEKPTTGVSGRIRLKTLKGTVVRKNPRLHKYNSSLTEDVIKGREEALVVMVTSTSMGSVVADLASQATDAEASTGQLFFSRLQTITPSMPPLKTRISKRRRSKKRDAKSRRKNKGGNTWV
ncbi:uncharacterized protein proca1 isoform X1 [Tachysurus fulvidraco]|uniref:uncharacterized protein proca1 isoform X1 n=1 Tax=Tachysurus fulvidraco TaxID=1234273 RepID=UPI001FEFE926|nr:uncharacterized protein proca1 isoform X1 [Tachysurus fulvidraco]